MQIEAFLKKWRVHLIFGGGLLAYFLIYTVANLFEGQSLLSAVFTTVRSVKPFEYVMTACLWCVIASQRQPERSNSFTSLDLGNSKN